MKSLEIVTRHWMEWWDNNRKWRMRRKPQKTSFNIISLHRLPKATEFFFFRLHCSTFRGQKLKFEVSRSTRYFAPTFMVSFSPSCPTCITVWKICLHATSEISQKRFSQGHRFAKSDSFISVIEIPSMDQKVKHTSNVKFHLDGINKSWFHRLDWKFFGSAFIFIAIFHFFAFRHFNRHHFSIGELRFAFAWSPICHAASKSISSNFVRQRACWKFDTLSILPFVSIHQIDVNKKRVKWLTTMIYSH